MKDVQYLLDPQKMSKITSSLRSNLRYLSLGLLIFPYDRSSLKMSLNFSFPKVIHWVSINIAQIYR